MHKYLRCEGFLCPYKAGHGGSYFVRGFPANFVPLSEVGASMEAPNDEGGRVLCTEVGTGITN
jgi:hypothetical protein